MKNFIVIYHASKDAMKQNAEMSPEEMKKGMEPWMVWANKCGDNLVDMGTPLSDSIKLSPDGKSSKTENGVVGYSILKAENLDGAKVLMEGHPHLQWNAECEIEIHETMALPGM